MTDFNPLAAGPAERHRELPTGVADRLPEDAARFIATRRTLFDTLHRWGYRPVVPPLMEYGETFSRPLPDPGAEVDLYKLVDRATGHVLAIRPDFTPQVARMAATRFKDGTLPLRLCYEGPVLRHVPERRGRSREVHQVGAEFLGVRDPEADAEAIALSVACLEAAGVTGFRIDLGQVEFYRGVVRDLHLSRADGAALTSAVARKDASELDRLLKTLDLPDPKKRLLSALPMLAGGPQVLDQAADLVESDHSRAALDNLAQVVHFVDLHGLTDRLTIDLGEIRGIDYHTGVIFEAFVPHLGSPLTRGGRYDSLVARYGFDLPATGFAIDLSATLTALDRQGAPSTGDGHAGTLIINFAPDRRAALALARSLRDKGLPAARDLMRRPLDASLAHARAQGFGWAAIIGEDDVDQDRVLLVHLATDQRITISADRVTARVAAEE